MAASEPDTRQPTDKSDNFEKLLDDRHAQHYVLRLYVTGLGPRSVQAISNLKNICEEELQGHYQLEVIDLTKRPELAKVENIIATPTLIKQLPLPLRRVIGDLSNKEGVLLRLDLSPRPETSDARDS